MARDEIGTMLCAYCHAVETNGPFIWIVGPIE